MSKAVKSLADILKSHGVILNADFSNYDDWLISLKRIAATEHSDNCDVVLSIPANLIITDVRNAARTTILRRQAEGKEPTEAQANSLRLFSRNSEMSQSCIDDGWSHLRQSEMILAVHPLTVRAAG